MPHSTCLPACRLIPDNPRRLLIFSSGGPDVPPHGLQSTIKSRDCSSVAIMTRLPPTRLLAPGPALNLIDRLPRYPEADTYPLPTKKRTGPSISTTNAARGQSDHLTTRNSSHSVPMRIQSSGSSLTCRIRSKVILPAGTRHPGP